MERFGMKQNTATEEAKSQVDKKPYPKLTSLSELPLWLVTSFFLILASLISLIYFFLKGRGSKPMAKQGGDDDLQLLESKQVNDKSVVAAHQGFDIIKNKSGFTPFVEEIKQPDQKQNFITKWLDLLSTWSFPELTAEQLKKIAASAVGPLLALVTAYAAQSVFDSTTGGGAFRNWEWLVSMPESSRLWIGAGLYLIAVLIWIFTAPAMPLISSIINKPEPSNSQTKSYHPIRLLLLFASIVIYFLSVLSFSTNGETGFVRGLWAAGLICFILSQLPYTAHPESEESPRFQWQNWLVLGLILAVGFWLRFYQIATIPDDLHGDMASHGWVARDFLLGTQKDIFGFGWTATPTIGFLPAFLTMAVFGNNIFGLQMAAVIGGTFSLFAIYLLTWRLFNSHRLAVLTTALVAINVVHIHFSRIFNMEPWPLSNFAIFLFIDGLKARRSTSFGLAGVFLGFSMLMYTSGRVLPFILVVFFVYALVFQRAWITQNLWGFAALMGGIVITMGPALVFYLMNWDTFVSRSHEVFIFSPGVLEHLLNKYNTDSPLIVLLTQIKLSLLMFNQASDTSSQLGYPHPMFSSLISPLILLGLGFALRRWKDASMAFVLIWLGLTGVMGSVLTIDAPFWPRLVGIVPAAALLIAVALSQILELGRKIFNTQAVIFIIAFMTIFLASVGYLTWNEYYLFVKDSGSPSTLTGRYIGRLPLDVTACGILTEPQLTVRETSFLAWPHKLVDIAPDAPDSELDKCTGSSIVWAISPENISRLDAIRARWPNGILDEQYITRRNYTMTFYLVGVVPPESQAEKTFDFSTWIFNFFSIFIPFILCVVLAWFVFQDMILKKGRERQVEKKVVPILPNIPRQPKASKFEGNIIVGFGKWYNEITTFVAPAITPKLIASIFLPILAVGLAYFAQTFLDQPSRLDLHVIIEALSLESKGQQIGIASLIFFVAALLWVFTTTNIEKEPPRMQVSQNSRPLQPTMGSSIQVIGFFLTITAIILYAVMGENAFVRWLWLAGLGFFLASLLVKKQNHAMSSREESPSFRWWHVLALLFLLILAFFLRVYHLYDVPLDLSTDMASVGISARDYLMGMETRIFGTGWYYYPRLVFLPYAASMWLTGNNLYGLNFGTVIMGTLNILGVYLFVWRLFDRHRLALLTAVLVTINPAHIEFSRIPSYVDPWFLGFFGLFFFMDGLKGRRWTSLALAGLFTGFALLGYPSGRAIIPIILIGLASAWFFRRSWVTDNYGGLVWMALGMLVTLGPNLVYVITDWSVYMRRSSEVIIFDPGVVEHLKATYEVDSIWMIIWEQVKRSVLQFNYYADRSAQFFYPYPMFNSLISPILFLGFGMSLKRWRKPEFLFLISSFSIILVMGSILTNDAPTWVRLVGIIPLAALLIALVLDEFVCLLERLSLKPFIPFLLIGIALFLGQLAVVDWNIYLNFVGNEDIVRPEIHVGRYLDTLPDEISVCGITDQREYLVSQEEIKFLGWPHSIVVVPEDTAVLTPDLCPDENVVWILSPIYDDRLSEIQDLSPGGVVKRHYTASGWHVFTSYMLSDQTIP